MRPVAGPPPDEWIIHRLSSGVQWRDLARAAAYGGAVIGDWYRTKGGAPLLGVRPGEDRPGPFGRLEEVAEPVEADQGGTVTELLSRPGD